MSCSARLAKQILQEAHSGIHGCLRPQERLHQLPLVAILINIIDLAQRNNTELTRRSLGSADNCGREDVELWCPLPCILRCSFAVMPIAAVQHNEHDEITVEIADWEATVEVRGPAALDLDAA